MCALGRPRYIQPWSFILSTNQLNYNRNALIRQHYQKSSKGTIMKVCSYFNPRVWHRMKMSKGVSIISYAWFWFQYAPQDSTKRKLLPHYHGSANVRSVCRQMRRIWALWSLQLRLNAIECSYMLLSRTQPRRRNIKNTEVVKLNNVCAWSPQIYTALDIHLEYQDLSQSTELS